MRFPLVMDQYCHMHLLNSNRLSMLPHVMKLRDMGISQIRIEGRYMEPHQLKETIANYKEYLQLNGELSEEKKSKAMLIEGSDITRGHYFRGVL